MIEVLLLALSPRWLWDLIGIAAGIDDVGNVVAEAFADVREYWCSALIFYCIVKQCGVGEPSVSEAGVEGYPSARMSGVVANTGVHVRYQPTAASLPRFLQLSLWRVALG